MWKMGDEQDRGGPAASADRGLPMGAAGGMIALVETVAFSDGEPAWVFPEGSVTEALLTSLSASSERMRKIAAMLPGGHAGWTGSGFEYCLYPSGQRNLSGYAENADVTFTIELLPPGFYPQAPRDTWEVTAEISVRCDAEIDCGMHTLETFTPKTYNTANEAVSAVAAATRWLFERSNAVLPGDWRARDPRSRHP